MNQFMDQFNTYTDLDLDSMQYGAKSMNTFKSQLMSRFIQSFNIFSNLNDVEHICDEVGNSFAHLGRVSDEFHGFVDGLGAEATAAR